LARRLGGSPSSRCGTPFFPRVLEHLVGLDRRVGQRRPVESFEGQLLEAVAEFEQLGAATAQLAGELSGGDALGDAAEDQDQLDRPPLGPPECRSGEGVEDATAGGAAIDEDRGAVAAMDLESVAFAAVRAGQAVGMEQDDEEFIAGGLVHQLVDREVHGRVLIDAVGLVRPHLNRSASARKVLRHRFPDMSHHSKGDFLCDRLDWTGLVRHKALILGYSRFSFTQASSIRNCQSTPRWLALVLAAQAAISICSKASPPMRRPLRHWLVRQLSSHSATFSQGA
jgi:hypothetical protein